MRTPKTRFTPNEYLAMERAADYKSEYYNGEIYAMTGGTNDHSRVAVNCMGEIRQSLKSKPCRVYNSDMRMWVSHRGLDPYPDAMIVCGTVEYDPRQKIP